MSCALCNKVSTRVQASARPSRRCSVAVQANGRRELLGLVGLTAFSIAAPAMAGVTEDLLAKSTVNKELNDKKRLATSYANLARSRTVSDGTCTVFTNNFLGCEELAPKPVKYITEDRVLECEATGKGKCNSRMTGFTAQ